MKEYHFSEGCNQGIGLPVDGLALGWRLQEGKFPGESGPQTRPQRMGRSEGGAEEGKDSVGTVSSLLVEGRKGPDTASGAHRDPT